MSWTVAASYQPFSYDDYFYEGSEVPEGEMLIEKIKVPISFQHVVSSLCDLHFFLKFDFKRLKRKF